MLNEKKVILNWLPPALSFFPSPAMTVLKGALKKGGIDCVIVYWNILLEDLIREYYFGQELDSINDVNILGLFYAAIALDEQDENALIKQIMHLESIKPAYLNSSFDFRTHIIKCVNKLKKNINDIFQEYNFNNCIFCGFSMNLFQWVASSYIGKILKSTFPNVIQVIGGIGNSELAKDFLQIFPNFDISLWGEGEETIVRLAESLINFKTIKKENVSHGFIRVKNLIVQGEGQFKFWPLTECSSGDYDDFFNVYKGDKKKIAIPLESSRGCHWNRCKFCFLNQGYCYRVKPVKDLYNEIKNVILNYHIFNFNFMDNDIIGRDHKVFEEMLASLIQIKEEFPYFSIKLAEIVSKDINRELIKRMSLAGFKHVQIGYESPSDKILAKINKKNTFASNLLFCKWASIYKIHIGGMNILEGLLDESIEDIQEGINNLKFQRFFKTSDNYKHSQSCLAINKVSRYFNELSEQDKDCCYYDPIRTFLPNNYIPKEFEWKVFHFMRKFQDSCWPYFHNADKYFEINEFSYTLTKYGNSITYCEFLNNGLISELEFEEDNFEWRVLHACNDEVRKLKDIAIQFQVSNDYLKTIVLKLYNLGLLYYSVLTDECITVINTLNFN